MIKLINNKLLRLAYTIITFGFILLIAYQYPLMAKINKDELKECIIESNCVKKEWRFKNTNKVYRILTGIAKEIPRTEVKEETEEYWHAICRSRVFRFPDDLEILSLPGKGIIQIRSASRYGLGDLGVNRRRINMIYQKLIKYI